MPFVPPNCSQFFLDTLPYTQKHDNGKREGEWGRKEKKEEGEEEEEEKGDEEAVAVAKYSFIETVCHIVE